MIRRLPQLMAIVLLTGASGCVRTDLADAVSAGIFDFVSGTVTALLSGLLPIAGG